MLSRTAENLYWLARYVERAEYLARTIDATLRVTALPAAYIGKTNEWDSALLTAGVSASFYQVYQEANEQNVVEYLSFAPGNPSSIRNCIENARLNSRSVRTALTVEMWDAINGAWLELQRFGSAPASRERLSDYFRPHNERLYELVGTVWGANSNPQGSPTFNLQEPTGSPLLADLIKEMGFKKADDFYIALGATKISPKVVVNKVMQRLKQGEAAEGEDGEGGEGREGGGESPTE